MKKTKIGVILTFILTVIFSFSVFAEIPKATEHYYFNDFADILSSSTSEHIAKVNDEIAETGAQIVVATVDFTDGEDIVTYGTKMFNQWEIGDAEKNNGVLILIAMGNGECQVIAGSGIESYLSSGGIQLIVDNYLFPDLEAGDFDAGVIKTVDVFKDKISEIYLDKASAGTQANAAEIDLSQANYVIDKAGVLSEKAKNEIIVANEKMYSENGGQIVIVALETTGGTSIDVYAEDLFDELQIGDRTTNNGIILVFATNDGTYWAHPGAGLQSKMNSNEIQKILDRYFESDFDAGNYEKGVLNTFNQFSNMIYKYYGTNANSSPTTSMQKSSSFVSWISDVFRSVFIIVIIAFVLMILLGSRSSVRNAYYGPEYYGPGYYPRRRWWRPYTWFYPHHHHHHHHNSHGGSHSAAPPPSNNFTSTRSSGSIFGGGSGGSKGSGGGRTSGSSSGGGFFGGSSSGGSSFGGGRSGGSSFGGGGGRSSGGGGGRSGGGGGGRSFGGGRK